MAVNRITYKVTGQGAGVDGTYAFERQVDAEYAQAWRVVELAGRRFTGEMVYSPAELLWDLDCQIRSEA